jgi:hypothetical protein
LPPPRFGKLGLVGRVSGSGDGRVDGSVATGRFTLGRDGETIPGKGVAGRVAGLRPPDGGLTLGKLATGRLMFGGFTDGRLAAGDVKAGSVLGRLTAGLLIDGCGEPGWGPGRPAPRFGPLGRDMPGFAGRFAGRAVGPGAGFNPPVTAGRCTGLFPPPGVGL